MTRRCLPLPSVESVWLALQLRPQRPLQRERESRLGFPPIASPGCCCHGSATKRKRKLVSAFISSKKCYPQSVIPECFVFIVCRPSSHVLPGLFINDMIQHAYNDLPDNTAETIVLTCIIN